MHGSGRVALRSRIHLRKVIITQPHIPVLGEQQGNTLQPNLFTPSSFSRSSETISQTTENDGSRTGQDNSNAPTYNARMDNQTNSVDSHTTSSSEVPVAPAARPTRVIRPPDRYGQWEY